MQQLVAAFFSLFVSTSDAEALMQTAPDTRLTIQTAMQHIASARFAGVIADVDPDLLLAIGHHEARYEPAVVGPLVRGKRACGVLQHVPIAGDCPTPSILRDYVDGARHLAVWIRAMHGNIDRALIGYAGGYALLDLCDQGEAPHACSIAQNNLARARRIKRERYARSPREQRTALSAW